MIGTMNVTVGGEDYKIKADWAAGSLLYDRVGDPLTIMADFALTAIDANHSPEVTFDLITSIKILHCGMEAAGHNVSPNDLGNEFIGKKSNEVGGLAAKFISLFGPDIDMPELVGDVAREAGEDAPGK